MPISGSVYYGSGYIARQNIEVAGDTPPRGCGTSREPAVGEIDPHSCLVIRRGAIGDYLVAGSVMHGLKGQGYRVTVLTNSRGADVLANNPNIDEFFVEDGPANARRDARRRALFARVVDLDDSLEGLMIARKAQRAYSYPAAARRQIFEKNYQELAHLIAGIPVDIRDGFYPTPAEIEWAKGGRDFMAGKSRCVAWAINGSAIHKIYPYVNIVARQLAERKIHVVLLGGPDMSRKLEKGILKTLEDDGTDGRFIHPAVGQWSIRESITFARAADCVVGPETGLMLGVAMTATPKVIYLSHSSPDNLTRHWINTTTLTPLPEHCSCYPCHRMHSSWDTCNRDKAERVARCAAAIPPQVVLEAIIAATER